MWLGFEPILSFFRAPTYNNGIIPPLIEDMWHELPSVPTQSYLSFYLSRKVVLFFLFQADHTTRILEAHSSNNSLYFHEHSACSIH